MFQQRLAAICLVCASLGCVEDGISPVNTGSDAAVDVDVDADQDSQDLGRDNLLASGEPPRSQRALSLEPLPTLSPPIPPTGVDWKLIDPEPPAEPRLSFREVENALTLNEQWRPPKRFTEVECGQAELFTGGAAVADFDGDGAIDVFLARVDQPSALFRGDGAGDFADVTALVGLTVDGSANGAAWADIDGDGDLDLVVAYLRNEGLSIHIQDNGTFTEETQERLGTLPPLQEAGCLALSSISAGDVDRDGDIDIHVSQWEDVEAGELHRSFLLLNNGMGHFVDGTLESGVDTWGSQDYTAIFGHFDEDLWPDLALIADFGESRFFRNKGNGSFTDETLASGIGTDENGMGGAVGDVDGDGDLDLFVTAIRDDTASPCPGGWGCSGNRLYANDGSGVFEDQTDMWDVRDGGWGWGASFFDADLDGDLDLGMTNGHTYYWDIPAYLAMIAPFIEDRTRLWLNQGPVPMNEASFQTGLQHTGSGKAFIPFDMDNDGDLDILITNNADTPTLFRNDITGRSWLRVRLAGHTNRFGIGAQVWLTLGPGDTPMRRDVTANSTYLGHGPLEAHFGLADHTGPIHELEVIWPDTGESQVLNDVAPHQVLTVTQPSP